MNIHANWRRVATAAIAVGFAFLLSGCMLTSETNLVSPDEGTEVLQTGFSMTMYDEEEGTLAPSEDGAIPYTLKGTGYVDPEGSMTAYFVPIEGDKYLLALAAADGSMYGVARLRDGIIEIRMVFSGDPEAEAGALGSPLPPNVAFAEGGVMVTDRASLDAVIALIDEGKLSTAPFIAWVGSGDPPATLVRDGDWYKAGS